jgi:hypothetical protein
MQFRDIILPEELKKYLSHCVPYIIYLFTSRTMSKPLVTPLPAITDNTLRHRQWLLPNAPLMHNQGDVTAFNVILVVITGEVLTLNKSLIIRCCDSSVI